MEKTARNWLTFRERQIMDVLYRRRGATVSEVLTDLSDSPGQSALRAILRELEEKGHVEREAEGAEQVYRPTLPGEEARERALERLVRTFFGGRRVDAGSRRAADQSGDGRLNEGDP